MLLIKLKHGGFSLLNRSGPQVRSAPREVFCSDSNQQQCLHDPKKAWPIFRVDDSFHVFLVNVDIIQLLLLLKLSTIIIMDKHHWIENSFFFFFNVCLALNKNTWCLGLEDPIQWKPEEDSAWCFVACIQKGISQKGLYLPTYVSTYWSTYIFTYISTSPSVYLPICCLSICLSTYQI